MKKTNSLNLGNSFLIKFITVCGLIFLSLPIIIVVIYSFNSSRSVTVWESFSLKWYSVLLNDRTIWFALKNSIIVAIFNTIIATVFGTMIALGLSKYSFKGKQILTNLLYVPMIIPEIIFGIALLSLFVMIKYNLGLISIISAHITFSISFVTLVVMAKLKYLDKSIEEASLDLGATRWQTFIKIIFPNILPGIIAGAIFAFTLSIDDFVITFFTAGIGSSTLPLRIYTLIKFGVTPVLNAISTVLIIITILVIMAAYLLQKTGKLKIIGIAITTFVMLFFATIFSYSLYLNYNREVINIGNWADYLSPDVIKKFEDETGIFVNLDYFNDNEELMTKLQTGTMEYDIVFSSQYMAKMFADQNLIIPIDFNNIPNLKNIDTRFHDISDTYYNYYVPYTYGFTGIVYNSELVDEEVNSWTIFLDEKYKDKMIIIDDMREAFNIAYKILGWKMEEIRPNELQKATELLLKQKTLLLKYDASMIFEYMLSNQAVISQYWNGAAVWLEQEDKKFKFVLPKEGSAVFIDTLNITSKSKNKANAEKFINFLLNPEIAAMNIEYILYSMPVEGVQEHLPDVLKNNKNIFPEIDELWNYDCWVDFGEQNQLLERAWSEVKSR